MALLIIATFTTGFSAAQEPSIAEDRAAASIDDSFHLQSRSRAHLFYVKLMDGEDTENASKATSGRGSQLFPRGTRRQVPSQLLNLHLVGEVVYSAPAAMLFGDKRSTIEGKITFTPEVGRNYLVTGELSQDYSAIWIEDIHGNVVSDVLVQYEENSADSSGAEQRVSSIKSRTGRSLNRTELFVAISAGESADLVQAKLGPPDKTSTYRGNILAERPAHVMFMYDGLGSIQFSSDAGEPGYVQKVNMEIQVEFPKDSLADQLDSADPQTLARLVRRYYQQQESDPEVLDLFAAKAWRERGTGDKRLVDTLSWVCKVLGQSQNSRYKTVLQAIASEASDKKLRKYAQSSLALLPDEATMQFQFERDGTAD